MRRVPSLLAAAAVLTISGTLRAETNVARPAVAGALATAEAKVIPSAAVRFADEKIAEVPSLQRHVLPLMGRLGCNGRACHGSFQGQGGFRLSLFGYDFKTDYEAIVKSETPRVDLKNVSESMILAKPSSDVEDEHGGGKRMDVGSWQYRLISRWIEAGAPKVDEEKDPTFVRMDVTPTEIVYTKPGETTQLKVVAHWSDGTAEDVTPLCRFTTNDDAVAKVDLNGKITCVGKGDTHVVAFYDNGVVPVATMLPVSEQTGKNFPEVAVNTKVDELVVEKLKKVGIVPSPVCNDEEFLRRASLDVTGQLPSADEVKAFVASTDPQKRAKKVDELLSRPGYAAWWATKLSDILGNSENQLRNNAHPRANEQWYRWINRRLAENVPYDDIVEGIVLAVGRSSEEQSFLEYCAEMTSYCRDTKPADFTERETMPYYWMRRNMRTQNEKALSFSYAFLGVRLQCAECHKHPFDQWSQYDFQHFTAFFSRVSSGNRERELSKQLVAKLGIETDPKKVGGAKIKRDIENAASDGKIAPFDEVYIQPVKQTSPKRSKSKLVSAGRVITPKVLGGDEIVDQNYDDPREPLMDWLRQKDNPYFARSFVNRVWSHYFNVGIVEPADDMNLANAPSNKELLDYLATAFIEHDYDIKWLMREIVNSDAYQRSWHVNPTNEYDLRNFSHAVPRRLPAEVVYDAVIAATAGKAEFERRRQEPIETCSIGLGKGFTGRNNYSQYALTVFGKPKRETPCDCERSNEPSLLQTVYLRNDQEMFSLIERKSGWLNEIAGALPGGKAVVDEAEAAKDLKDYRAQLVKLQARRKQLHGELTGRTASATKSSNKKTSTKKLSDKDRERMKQEVARIDDKIEQFKQRIADLELASAAKPNAGSLTLADAVTEAYLRTFSRAPTPAELKTGEQYIAESADPVTGLRDLVWALVNSKEFVVNH